MSTPLPFPDRVKAYRTGLGLSQAAFAATIGVDQATLSRIERGAEPSKPLRLLLERLLPEEVA